MVTVAEATADFLAQKRIAVAGVSRNAGAHSGNAVYDRLVSRGYETFAVNPNADEIDGKPCFRSLAAIPGGVDAVVIATAPDAAADVIADCERLGIKRVWMHRSFGGGSVSEEAAVGGSQGRHDGHRRRLSADVRAHRGRRAQVHALGHRVHVGQAHRRLTTPAASGDADPRAAREAQASGVSCRPDHASLIRARSTSRKGHVALGSACGIDMLLAYGCRSLRSPSPSPRQSSRLGPPRWPPRTLDRALPAGLHRWRRGTRRSPHRSTG